MLVAGLETMPTNESYNSILSHLGGKGFTAKMSIRIESNGYINVAGFDFYIIHAIVLSATWGLLALLQLSSSRYLKMYVSVSLWTHRISGFLIFLATMTIALLTFK